MPSFKLLPDSEIEALVDYVKYLSIRGEVERRLIDETTSELDVEDRLIDDENMADATELIMEDILASVVDKWGSADDQITPVPQRPDWQGDELLASIETGKELFYGAVANCVKCHGDSQLGDGQVDDYDDWAKDYADDWIKETDEKKKDQLLAHVTDLGCAAPTEHHAPQFDGPVFIVAAEGRSISTGEFSTASKARPCPPP